MVTIVIYFGLSAQTYAQTDAHWQCPRPQQCPRCQAEGKLIGHGCYWRKPKGLDFNGRIGIRRWYCQACETTIGCLPEFLLPRRHYVVDVVAKVLMSRLLAGFSWSQLQQTHGADGTPAVRTMQRWLGALARYAPRWLRAIWQAMVNQQWATRWLAPRGPTAIEGQAGDARWQLLATAVAWQAWGREQWPALADLGASDWLLFLGLWGSGQQLGRLL